MKLRLGTRASDLALAQSRRMARRLEAAGHQVEFVTITTDGDRDQVRPFLDLGPAGLFVRALEEALLLDQIDLAVHSYKDLPSLSPKGLEVAAMPERRDVRDRLIVHASAFDGRVPHEIPIGPGLLVGTASARRVALLSALRPDLRVGLLRGNVPTRLAKLDSEPFDAILLAAAGLQRLDDSAGLGEMVKLDRTRFVEVDLDPTKFVPAPSQGALALQIRSEDGATRSAVVALDDAKAHAAVRVERDLLALVEAGCQVPFGAWCDWNASGQLTLSAFLEREGEPRWVHLQGSDGVALAQQAHRALLEPEGAA